MQFPASDIGNSFRHRWSRSIMRFTIVISSFFFLVQKEVMFMAKKQFKIESKKLLEMMVNSIYTLKKSFYESWAPMSPTRLTSSISVRWPTPAYVSHDDFEIRLTVDKDSPSWWLPITVSEWQRMSSVPSRVPAPSTSSLTKKIRARTSISSVSSASASTPLLWLPITLRLSAAKKNFKNKYQ